VTEISAVEFDYCRELAMPPGSLFEFTSRFLKSDQLKPLLALYALKQSVCNIPFTPVDDTVKWAKLKWWSEELLADPDSPSRHPVLRAMWESGARGQVSNALLLGLISSAVMQIDASPDSDEDGMLERLSASGVPEVQVELALAGAEIDSQHLGFLAAASGLSRMVSSFAPGQQAETERLPMNILAKFDVSSAQLQQDSSRTKLSLVISQLAEIALDWFSKGMTGLKVALADGAETDVVAHLQLRWAMEKRGLDIIRKDTGAFINEGRRFGPTDAWFAWRFLRQLR
jgi:phytoene/squalene synthetase